MNNSLCSECQALASKNAVLWQVIANGNGKVGITHYASATLLHQSANSGCSLCSLMWASLHEYRKRDLPDDQNIMLYFWRDRSEDFFTMDKRDEIRLDVHCGDHESEFVGYLSCVPGDDVFNRLFPAETSPTLDDTVTSSKESSGRIKAWMRMCDELHAECRVLKAKDSSLPTRVIRVGISGSASCKLVDGAGLEGPYAALSHCWGALQPLTTTMSTLAQRQSGIPDDYLPQTFRDAVQVCRELGVPYLWIDSICIIQDSKADWTQEAPTMGAVYTNATLTLSASSAQDSTQGLFQPRAGLPIWPCLTTIFTLPCRVTRHPSSWDEVYGDLRSMQDRLLDRRAWVMQEQVLAGRTIAFGATELTWTCHSLHASETQPLGLPSVPQTSMDYRRLLGRVLRADMQVVDSLPRARVYGFWYRSIMDFSARNLTFQHDKLPAVAGLAQRFGAAMNDEYCAGLWIKDIYTGLLWKSGADIANAAPTRRLETYRAPSWTWASIDGFVDYVRVVPSLDQPEDVELVPLASIEVDNVSGEHLGDATAERSCLRVSGSTFPVRYRSGTLYSVPDDVSSPKHADKLGIFWPDDSEAPDTSWICLPICTMLKKVPDDHADDLQAAKHQGDGIWCLVLVEVEGSTGVFQRVGICRVFEEDECGRVLERAVQLVKLVIQ